MSSRSHIRFPTVGPHDEGGPLGLGVGLDLPWGSPIGFQRGEVSGQAQDHIARRVVRYLTREADRFAYLFVSWQPRNRSLPRLEDYTAAFDDLFAQVGDRYPVRALHQTTLNLGSLERYDRSAIVAFTNELVARYDMRWVNEDLGLWSLNGRALPYPLPPFLTDDGLAAAVRNTREVQQSLDVPLLVEFPGFSEGTSFCVGTWHAYDFFREVVAATGSPATLDVGHLLSYQWFRGRRGEALYGELERLPLEHCFEIHLSGCAIKNDRFMDYHHGILMDEQLELLDRLVGVCPNLRAVTYEDPKFSEDGELTRKAGPNVERLTARSRQWQHAGAGA